MRDFFTGRSDGALYIIVGLGALFVACVVFSIYDAMVLWPRYRTEHHCGQTGQHATEIHFTYIHDEKGNVTSVIPYTVVRHEWRCDGEEYLWR